jgi:hypothetical protein
MMIDGVTIPKVANIPPGIPPTLLPTNVAVFTAITPGVHCPIA